MTKNDLVTLLENGLIKVTKNRIPNVSLNKIISHIKYNYDGVIDFNSNILKINDSIVEIEGHKFEWFGDKILKMR